MTATHTHSCTARVRHGRHVTRVVGDPCVIVPALVRAAAGGRWTWTRPGTYLVPVDVADAVIAALEQSGVTVLVTNRPGEPDQVDCRIELLKHKLGATEIPT